jgi:hypothetical protein
MAMGNGIKGARIDGGAVAGHVINCDGGTSLIVAQSCSDLRQKKNGRP